MTHTVHIIALAARTPVGLRAESSAAAIRAGISRVADHPFMVDAEGEPLRCARDSTLQPMLLGTQRLIELARQALTELATKLSNAGLSSTLSMSLALPEERPGFDARDAEQLLKALNGNALPGLKIMTREAGRGHAGAFLGLEQAVRRIAGGEDEIVVVGGVDGYLQAATLEWLDTDQRLARARRRGGFPPGEGAALIALASDGIRKQLRLPSLALVRSVVCTRELRDETSPEGLQGEALTEAYWRVGQQLNRPAERFDDLYCDINAEGARTTDLGFALLRAGDVFRDGTAYVTAVGQVGDVGAATAPLNCILAARAWARGYALGSTALVSGASWTGLRGAALLHRTAGA